MPEVPGDQFDVTLTDDELMYEVGLTTSLMVAASAHEGPLTQAEIDGILGVRPPIDAGLQP